jgi:methyl-accepting chemotaxis protein
VLKNITIRSRLYASAALSLLVMLVLGGLAAYSAHEARNALASVYEGQISALLELNEVDSELKEIRFRMAAYAIDQMPAVGNKNHLADARVKIPVAWEEFKARAAADQANTAALIAKIDKQLPTLPAFFDRLEAAYEADHTSEVTPLLENEWPRIHAGIIKPLGQLIPIQRDAAKATYERSNARAKALFALTGVVVLIAAVLLVGFTVLLVRAITVRLQAAIGVARNIAKGDLTTRISSASHDEVGVLIEALQGMNESLARIVSHVRTSTGATASAIGEMVAGNTGLSQRTEEQASSLEETAATMEQLTASARQNAEGARHGTEVATRAATVAVKGGEVVARVVGTMSSINSSSRRVVDIIGLIDGIAFQTNILALNAAVEAARAGEHGRGFAVVASEVRVLAQRAAAAAKDIKTLIGDSAAKVEDGTKLVQEAGRTMSETVESIKQVEQIMARIAGASNEQASGIEQVNQTLTQLDDVTQQNAALVEQASASMEALQHQAQDLAGTISVFKVAAQEAAAGPEARESLASGGGERAAAAGLAAGGAVDLVQGGEQRRRLPPGKRVVERLGLTPELDQAAAAQQR